MDNTSNKKLSLFALTMLITGAIDSVRNLPTTALFGSNIILYMLLAAAIFFIPCGLVSAQLTAKNPKESGIYVWVRNAFGENIGFLAIWLQWINTMVWYPAILSFAAGGIAYLICPSLAENRLYLVTIILLIFWSITFINLKSLHTSALFANFCTIIGMVIPMLLIIITGIIWVSLKKPLAISFSWHSTISSLQQDQSWISITVIMSAFLGIELSSVHINNIHNAPKNFPLALFFSISIILLTLMVGSLTIAFIIPNSQINLVTGVIQVFSIFLSEFHLSFLLPILISIILIGSIGSMVNWIIAPAKGLIQAGESGFLPKSVLYKNTQHIPTNLLLLQATIVSILCLAYLLLPTVNSCYWLLTDLSTELYILMYSLMFLSSIKIHFLQYKTELESQPFSWLMKNIGVPIIGLTGCLIALAVGFFPPQNIIHEKFFRYELLFIMGLATMLLPVLGFYYYRKKTIKIPSNKQFIIAFQQE